MRVRDGLEDGTVEKDWARRCRNLYWVVISNMFYVHPETWGRFLIWLIFFKGVETTNQISSKIELFFWNIRALAWHIRHDSLKKEYKKWIELGFFGSFLKQMIDLCFLIGNLQILRPLKRDVRPLEKALGHRDWPDNGTSITSLTNQKSASKYLLWSCRDHYCKFLIGGIKHDQTLQMYGNCEGFPVDTSFFGLLI